MNTDNNTNEKNTFAYMKLSETAKIIQSEINRINKQREELTKGLVMPNFEEINTNYDNLYQEVKGLNSFERIVPEDYFDNNLEYQKKLLEQLESINNNTSVLPEALELINKNVDNQEQIIKLINEIFSIAKAKDKEEAKSMFMKVLDKIKEVTDDIEAIQKLTNWACIAYKFIENKR